MIPSGLVLDFGEVLTRPQPRHLLDRMASIAQLPMDEFVPRYWRHRPAYDGGLPVADYWARVLDGRAGLRPDVVSALVDADVQSWSYYRAEVWQLAAEFRARGGRTAMLSNGVPEIVARLRKSGRLDGFDVVVVSCEVGISKPDSGIYRICLQQLGVTPAETLFVDDRRENVAAAEGLGLRTLHFTGDESVGDLRRLLDL